MIQCSIITIGDELLIGQVVDTNSSWMAQALNQIGIHVKEILSVSDTAEAIESGLNRSLTQSDLILLTGGLGPTKDDITKKVLADFFQTELVFHQPTFDRIVQFFEKLNRKTTEAHRIQCYLPASAEVLFNKLGTAPGMWFEHQGKIIISMPGVPYEMKYIMQHGVLPKVQEYFETPHIQHRTILTVGEGESRIAKRIEGVESQLPAHIKLAFLPSLGTVRLRLSSSGSDPEVLTRELDEQVAIIEEQIPELIFGYDNETLAQVVGRMLEERSMKLGTAESCTGGYIAHRITSNSGSSAYFSGSVIAYSNDIKEKVLGVKPETLENHGAVSEPTVIEMVQGVLNTLDVDLAIAVSGIAGPGGGTPEKPVGTIWLAAGNKVKIETRKLSLGKDRLQNIKYTATQALNMIRKFLIAQ